MPRNYTLGRSYCPTHRTMQDELDHFVEESLEPGGRQSFTVTELACGHYLQGGNVRIGPAPGAPYAPLGRLDGGDQPHNREGVL